MSGPILWEMAKAFVPLSFGTIGGGASAVAGIHGVVVARLRLDDRDRVRQRLRGLAPVAGAGIALVTLIGWEVAGVPGAVVATVALFLPTSILIAGVAAIWSRYRGSLLLSALETGLRPVAAGLILAAVLVLLQSLNQGWMARVLPFVSAAILLRFGTNPIVLIASGAAAYLLWTLAGLP